jgi:hypothetical protein
MFCSVPSEDQCREIFSHGFDEQRPDPNKPGINLEEPALAQTRAHEEACSRRF